MREEDGVIVIDSDGEEEESEDSSPRPPKRTKPNAVRAGPVSARKSAIQASALTSVLVDVEEEESSSDASEEDSDDSILARRGRGRHQPAKRLKVSTHKRVAVAKAARASVGKSSGRVLASNARSKFYSRLHATNSKLLDSSSGSEVDDSESSVDEETKSDDVGMDSDDAFQPRRHIAKTVRAVKGGKAVKSVKPVKAKVVKKRKLPPSSPAQHRQHQATTKRSLPQSPKRTPIRPPPPVTKSIPSPKSKMPAASLALSRRQAQILSEGMSLSELQAQERALARFHNEKKRAEARLAATSTSSEAMTPLSAKGELVQARKVVNSGPPRARAKVRAEPALESSSTMVVRPPPRLNVISNGKSSAPAIKSGTTNDKTTQVATVVKPREPLLHSTSWRGVYFPYAPPNLLSEVPALPYSTELNKPLTAYDPDAQLEAKCALVSEDADPSADTRSQEQTDELVRSAITEERQYVQACHERRVQHVVESTRAHVTAYLKAIQSRRKNPTDPRYELTDHQRFLKVSPTERVIAKRLFENASKSSKMNELVGTMCYFVQLGEQPTETAIHPETIVQLNEHITPLQRSSTYIGVAKSVFVEDDPVLRYVPYFGEHAQMSVDPKRYSATTLDKAKRVTLLGASSLDLKSLEPSARDNDVNECVLRAVVRRCGRSSAVFAVIEEDESGQFHQPADDYAEIEQLDKNERRASEQMSIVRKLVDSVDPNSSSTASSTEKTRAHYLGELTRSCGYLDDISRSLRMRLTSPPTNFETNLSQFPEAAGLRDCSEYEDVKEWYRDLFCRRCYSYDCEEHGIIQPSPTVRVDPILPVVSVPGIELRDSSANVVGGDQEGDAPSKDTEDHEVIELDEGESASDVEDDSKVDDGFRVEEDDEQPITSRRSVRSQTRISSMASNSLVVQEQMVERQRRREQIQRRRRQQMLIRRGDRSEYVDDSYQGALDLVFEQLQSDSTPCGSACWKAQAPDGSDVMSAIEKVLVTKLAGTLDTRNACLLAALLHSSSLSCARISKYLNENTTGIATSNDEGGVLSLGAGASSRNQRQQRKHDQRRRTSHRGKSEQNRPRAGSLQRVDDKKLQYIPCNHAGPCVDCDCVTRGHKCERACACSRDCAHRMRGCACDSGTCRTKDCPCWAAGRECDPDRCFSCGASTGAVLSFHADLRGTRSGSAGVCDNVNMVRQLIQKKVGVAFSATHGWGAYALEPIKKGEFVYEYVGGIISDDEAERRGSIYDLLAVSYLFDVNTDQVVDAMRQGNKIKFANHRAASDNANCETKIMVVNGEHRIALVARDDIEVGAELFFDYGYTHDTAPAWSQLGMRNPHRWGDDDDDDDDEWE